jgi:hypothetical protein
MLADGRPSRRGAGNVRNGPPLPTHRISFFIQRPIDNDGSAADFYPDLADPVARFGLARSLADHRAHAYVARCRSHSVQPQGLVMDIFRIMRRREERERTKILAFQLTARLYVIENLVFASLYELSPDIRSRLFQHLRRFIGAGVGGLTIPSYGPAEEAQEFRDEVSRVAQAFVDAVADWERASRAGAFVVPPVRPHLAGGR